MRRTLIPVLCLLLLLTACGKKQETTVISGPVSTATPPAPVWADATPDNEGVELEEAELEAAEAVYPSVDASAADDSPGIVKPDSDSTVSDNKSIGTVTVETVSTESCTHGLLETVKNEATCTEAGRASFVCKKCGKVVYEIALDPMGHNWAVIAEKDFHYSACTVCNQKTKTESHTFKNGVCTVCGYGCKHVYKDEITQATCLSDGHTTHICTLCGHSFADNITKASGHSYVLEKDADGKNMYVCTACGARMDFPEESAKETQSIDLPEVILD